MLKKILMMMCQLLSRFDTIRERDKQTDGRMDGQTELLYQPCRANTR